MYHFQNPYCLIRGQIFRTMHLQTSTTYRSRGPSVFTRMPVMHRVKIMMHKPS